MKVQENDIKEYKRVQSKSGESRPYKIATYSCSSKKKHLEVDFKINEISKDTFM